MMSHSHILFGMSCWWGYCLATGQDVSTTATAVAGLGALLPDIDHPQSALGRRIPFLSVPIAKVFGHRGITHSILATLAVAFVLTHWSGSRPDIIAPLCIGYLSHLGGDLLTPSGVPLFWPIRRTFSLGLFRTGSPVESVTVGALAAVMLSHADMKPGVLSDAQNGISMVLREGTEALDLNK